MADFPTLTAKPVEPLGKTFKDNTLVSESEAGYIRTRQINSRLPFSRAVQYNRMSQTDYTTLQTFFTDTVKGSSGEFNWIEPVTTTSYVVRFVKGSFNAQQLATGDWNVNFTVEQI
jgi:hypothetical protein